MNQLQESIIKKFESIPAPLKITRAVIKHLQELAVSDDQLANGMISEDKGYKELTTYLHFRANNPEYKQGSMAQVDDDVVYGWAVHYFVETKENIDVEMKPKTTEHKPKKSKSKAADVKESEVVCDDDCDNNEDEDEGPVVVTSTKKNTKPIVLPAEVKETPEERKLRIQKEFEAIQDMKFKIHNEEINDGLFAEH